MDVYAACRMSSVDQALYEDPYGNLYLATYDAGPGGGWSAGTMSFMKRKRKKKDWTNGNPWTHTFRDRGGNRWRPVAPYKNKAPSSSQV